MWRRSLSAALGALLAACTLLTGADDLRVGEGAPDASSVPDGSDGAADGATGDADLDAGPGEAGPAPGSLDTTFGDGGRVLVPFTGADTAHAVVVAADGTISVGGRTGSGIPTDFAVARLAASGALDTSFATTGKTTIDFDADYDEINGAALTADGKLVVAGRCWRTGFRVAMARLETNGALDTTFGTGGRVDEGAANANNQDGTFAMLLRPGDAPVVAGSMGGDSAVRAYLASGAVDPDAGAGAGGAGIARGIARQADGKIVVAGTTPPYSSATATDVFVDRFLPDLTLDTAFGTGGRTVVDVRVLDRAYAVAVDGAGRIVVAGTTTASDDDILVVRLTPSGAVDTTFGQAGSVVTARGSGSTDRARALAIDSAGRILVAGSTSAAVDNDVLLARYTSSGALDPTFGSGGVVVVPTPLDDAAYAIALAPDGRIVIAGAASNGTDTDFLVQRFWP